MPSFFQVIMRLLWIASVVEDNAGFVDALRFKFNLYDRIHTFWP
jgi:hypothetical protein